MLNYIIKRLFLIIPTLLGILTVNFIIIQAAPGGPVEKAIAQIKGTDMSVTERFTTSGGEQLSSNQSQKNFSSSESKYRGSQGIDPDLIKELNKSLTWIMSHPIAGSEVSGPTHGTKNLFLNKWCIVFEDKNKTKQKKLLKFWKIIGSKTIIMKADEHDKIFSITSHLPHLISYNLITTALDFQKKYKKNIIKFSAGGLRDFSRTAASNEIMWRDIFFSNKKNMLEVINLFIKNLNQFKKNIINFKNTKILKKLKNSKKVRSQIIELKQDISKPNFGREDN